MRIECCAPGASVTAPSPALQPSMQTIRIHSPSPRSRSDLALSSHGFQSTVFAECSFETVVVRPRFVWGVGDTTLLPVMVEMVRSGRFAWIGGGRHRTSTTHVENTVEGLVLGANRGRAGEAPDRAQRLTS